MEGGERSNCSFWKQRYLKISSLLKNKEFLTKRFLSGALLFIFDYWFDCVKKHINNFYHNSIAFEYWSFPAPTLLFRPPLFGVGIDVFFFNNGITRLRSFHTKTNCYFLSNIFFLIFCLYLCIAFCFLLLFALYPWFLYVLFSHLYCCIFCYFCSNGKGKRKRIFGLEGSIVWVVEDAEMNTMLFDLNKFLIAERIFDLF